MEKYFYILKKLNICPNLPIICIECKGENPPKKRITSGEFKIYLWEKDLLLCVPFCLP